MNMPNFEIRTLAPEPFIVFNPGLIRASDLTFKDGMDLFAICSLQGNSFGSPMDLKAAVTDYFKACQASAQERGRALVRKVAALDAKQVRYIRGLAELFLGPLGPRLNQIDDLLLRAGFVQQR